MSIKTTYVLMLILVLGVFAAGIYWYPQLPEQIASHWNASGSVDGYMNKFWGAFLLPLIIVGLLLIFWAIPHIDPLRENIKKFRNVYNIFVLMIVVFMAAIYAMTLAWNLGAQFDFSRFIMPLLGILFFFIGVFLPRTKRNWFMGIRTPWTLSSDVVWERTHRQGGILFKIIGIFTTLSIFISQQRNQVFIAIALIAATALWLCLYSYLIYRGENKSRIS